MIEKTKFMTNDHLLLLRVHSKLIYMQLPQLTTSISIVFTLIDNGSKGVARAAQEPARAITYDRPCAQR